MMRGRRASTKTVVLEAAADPSPWNRRMEFIDDG